RPVLVVDRTPAAQCTRPEVRQLPGGVSPPVAASSVAPIVGLSGLPASLPRTPSHSPDKPLNFRPDALASEALSDAVVLMAYGSPERLADVPAYYADIRGGRPIAPENLADLVERYRRLGIDDS